MSTSQRHFVYKVSLIKLLLTLFLNGITSLFFSLLAFILLFVLQEIFSFNLLSPFVLPISWLLIFLWMINPNGKIWYVRLDEDKLVVKHSFLRTETIQKSDITKLTVQKGKFVFHTFNQMFRLNAFESQMRFVHLLPQWLPVDKLPFELQQQLQDRERIALQSQLEAYPIVLTGQHILFATKLMLTHDSAQHQGLFRQSNIEWQEIEALGIQSERERLLIWRNGRYQAISLTPFEPDDLKILHHDLLRRSLAKNIPYTHF